MKSLSGQTYNIQKLLCVYITGSMITYSMATLEALLNPRLLYMAAKIGEKRVMATMTMLMCDSCRPRCIRGHRYLVDQVADRFLLTCPKDKISKLYSFGKCFTTSLNNKNESNILNLIFGFKKKMVCG